MNKMNLPTIDQVKDLPQDPAFPMGFASSPLGPCGLVQLVGWNSVIAFAFSFRWDTPDQRKSAFNWAKNTEKSFALAATIREFGDKVDSVQKKNINYSCNLANDFPGGSDHVLPAAFDTSTDPVTWINGGSFPANFLEGPDGDAGGVSSEKNQNDAKTLAFAELISDVRKGAYLLGAAVA